MNVGSIVMSSVFPFFLVEPPEVIDSRDLEYPDRQYRVDNLEMPEPILSSDGAKVKFTKRDSSPVTTSPDKSSKLRNNLLFSCFPTLHLSTTPPSLSLSLSLSLSSSSFPLSCVVGPPLILQSFFLFLSCSVHSW